MLLTQSIFEVFIFLKIGRLPSSAEGVELIDGLGTKTLLVLLQRISNLRSSSPTPDKARPKTPVLSRLSVPLLSRDYMGLEGKKNKHPSDFPKVSINDSLQCVEQLFV